MAYAATGLRKLAEGLFRYNAGADTAATVSGSGYFNSATHMLKQDDIIYVIGNSRATLDALVVSSATNAATVTTVAAEGVTAT
jgi:hypothetical protein